MIERMQIIQNCGQKQILRYLYMPVLQQEMEIEYADYKINPAGNPTS